MFNTNLKTITIGVSCINRSHHSKSHTLEQVCLVYVVTFITGWSYKNRTCLKKWHFLNLICSLPIVTITSGVSCSNKGRFKKSHFLDLVCFNNLNRFFFCQISSFQKYHIILGLVCSVCVVTIMTGLSYSNRSRLKKLHFLGLICSVHVLTIINGLINSDIMCLKKLHFLNLICSVPLVTITMWVNSSNMSRLKKGHFLELICAIYFWRLISLLSIPLDISFTRWTGNLWVMGVLVILENGLLL